MLSYLACLLFIVIWAVIALYIFISAVNRDLSQYPYDIKPSWIDFLVYFILSLLWPISYPILWLLARKGII